MTEQKETVAVVTGGSGYVGSAIIDMLVAHKYRVFNISRHAVEKNGVENILCDLADGDATRLAAHSILDNVISIDLFVHAACPPTTRKALEDTTEGEKRIEFAVAVEAASIFAETLLPHMREGSAFIGITTASLEKEVPEKNIGAYLPAKQALRDMLKELSAGWQKQGIRVYAVAPSFLPGGLNKDVPEGVRNLLARQKDGTVPTAENVASAIEHLLVATPAYPPGSSVTVPGGKPHHSSNVFLLP